MNIQVRNSCEDFNSYRAARVKSLFNAESGANFSLDADLPIDDADWKVGLIVGPSGSGKTSIGRQLFGGASFYAPTGWPDDRPIVDAIAPDGDFDAVTGALAAGDRVTGVSVFRVDGGVDTGPVLAAAICDVPPGISAGGLYYRHLVPLGVAAILRAVERIAASPALLEGAA